MPVGRPKKDNPRNMSLNIRLRKDEAEKIKSCADRLNLSRTDTIMKGIDMVDKSLESKKK